MKANLNYFIILFHLFLFSNSVVQDWIFENSARDITDSGSVLEYKLNYERDNKFYVELYKEIKSEDGEIKYKKNIKVYYDGDLLYGGEVNFDQIDSIYKIGDDKIVCPKGKFQPHYFYKENNVWTYSTLNLPDFVGSDWKLKCFYHPVGFFIVFYLMNGGGSQVFFKQLDTGNWAQRTFHKEIYDVKMDVDNAYSVNNGEYGLIYLVNDNDYLKIKGAKYTIQKNWGFGTNDCGGQRIDIHAKAHSGGCFENDYDHFYYFTYTNTSDFYCGYFDSYNDIGDQNVNSVTVTKYSDSPLIFVDQVEIRELKENLNL